MEIQKFEYLENEKILLYEIESVFNNFQGLSFGEKIKTNSRHKLSLCHDEGLSHIETSILNCRANHLINLFTALLKHKEEATTL